MKVRIYWLDVDDDNGTEPELFATAEAMTAAVRECLLGYWNNPDEAPDDLGDLYDRTNTYDDCVRWGFQDLEIEEGGDA